MSGRGGKRREQKASSLVVTSTLSPLPSLTDYERELLLPVAEKILAELFEPPGSSDEKEDET